MKTLACTGGIGSGKSFLITLFNALGVPSYDSDRRAKELYDENPRLMEDVSSAVGGGIVVDGRLDRRALASRIFSDPAALAAVEELVHPAVAEDFLKWKDRQVTEAGFVIFESAVILEKPAVRFLADRILVVTAPLETRIRRVVQRDGSTREQVLERMSRQRDDEFRLSCADFVIFADDSVARLPQVLEVMRRMREQ